MKKNVLLMLVAALLIILAACGSSDTSKSSGDSKEDASSNTQSSDGGKSAKKHVTIGITQIVEHPSLDGARKGFIEALKEGGYVEGKNLKIDYQNAQNDMSNNTTIAQKFASDNVDLILAVSTPSAQAALNATKDIPILFTAVTDPVGAKLVDSIKSPGGNVTGTSDTHPEAILNTVKTIHKFFPDSKKVGVIYNSGEQNSVKNVEVAKKAMAKDGLKAVEATVSTSADVKQAAKSLIGRVDVIYIPKDNTVVSALKSVISVANDQDIPLFVGESDSVKAGGFAGYGFSYEELGKKTGKMALEILNGKKPSEIPVAYPDSLNLVINEKAAKEEGIKLTDEMKQDAELVGKK